MSSGLEARSKFVTRNTTEAKGNKKHRQTPGNALAKCLGYPPDRAAETEEDCDKEEKKCEAVQIVHVETFRCFVASFLKIFLVEKRIVLF